MFVFNLENMLTHNRVVDFTYYVIRISISDLQQRKCEFVSEKYKYNVNLTITKY